MVHSSGISVLYEPREPAVDIIFVHGFTGHPKSTWTLETSKVRQKRPQHQKIEPGCEPTEARPKFLRLPSFPFSRARASQSQASSASDNSSIRDHKAPDGSSIAPSSSTNQHQFGDVYWPQDLLPSTAPKARILTYGYDTKIRYARQVSQNTVEDHSWDLLCSLEAVRRAPLEKGRPLVLIAHSLGGLVVKKMLKLAQDRATTHPHLNGVFLSTISILFFGTPHRGADPRSFLHHLLSISAQGLGVSVNKDVVASLMPNGEPVSTFLDFAALACERNWIIYSFQEEYGVASLFGKKVVDDHSSCLALPTIETTQHIGDNHMDMCRFFGRDDPGYQKVSAAIERILALMPSKSAPVKTTSEFSPRDCLPMDRKVTSILERGDATRDELEHEYSTEHALSQETMNILMDLLRFDQIDARLLTLRTAQGKTCEWFLSKPEYIQWQSNNVSQGNSSFLWIKGKPGTGKSILMKYLLAEADKAFWTSEFPRPIVISFFFNARGEQLEQSTLGCYRSLLLQLFEKDRGLQTTMNDLGTSATQFIKKNGWTIELLTQMLTKALSLLKAEQTLTCFVDALDECEEWDVRSMVSFFEGLGDSIPASTAHLRICFSSRHYPSIIPKKGLQITLEAEADHFEDISRFVETELRLGDSSQTEEIKEAIMTKCSNIFLWAAMVVPILNREYARGRMTAIRSRLDSLPPGLDELFEMILARDDEDMDELQICVKWILFAARPMRPEQLFIAIRLGVFLNSGASGEPKTKYPDGFSGADLRRYIESCSKGLAEITRSKEPTVQFIHESVRDFLLGKGRKNTHGSGFSPEVLGQIQDLLARCCLAQVRVMASCIENVMSDISHLDLSQYPFLEYAVNNVLLHSNSAEREKISQVELLQIFPLFTYILLFNTFAAKDRQKYRPDTSIVYILASQNLAHLIRIHPDSPRHLEIRGDRYMYPLIAAIILRNVEAVEALLTASGMTDASEEGNLGVCIKLDSQLPTVNSFNFTPWDTDLLSCLVQFDQLEMVQHYLKTISRSRHSDDLAGYEGHSEILAAEVYRLNWALFDARSKNMAALLIALGADPGTMNSHASTPLCQAAKDGKLEIVKLLTSPDNFPEIQLPQGLSSHFVASRIKSRVMASSADRFGWTPLHHAVNGGFSEIVDHLATIPEFNPNELTNGGETALHLAMRKGNWNMAIRLLSFKDLDPNIPNSQGVTPFKIAVMGDANYPINFLTSFKRHPHHTNAEPLQMFLASSGTWKYNSTRIVTLHFGRQLVRIQDCNGSTLLSAFIQSIPTSSENQPWVNSQIAIYLQFGADPNLRDKTGRSAISYAAELLIPQPLFALLSHVGVDADLSPDNAGRTPFIYAARPRAGHNFIDTKYKTLQLLINYSLLFVNTPDHEGRTPIWHVLVEARAQSRSLSDPVSFRTCEALAVADRLFSVGNDLIFMKAWPNLSSSREPCRPITPHELLDDIVQCLTRRGSDIAAIDHARRLQSKIQLASPWASGHSGQKLAVYNSQTWEQYPCTRYR
ncbi:hypothetical protein V8F20_002554 [Naviculisporaceae sp. PSN 640]